MTAARPDLAHAWYVLAGFELLDAQPALVAADPIPVPYARTLEEATLPSVERIAAAVRSVAAA